MSKIRHYYKSPRISVPKEIRPGSKTQPQFLSQTNIHSILKRSGLGEDMSFLARPVAYSGDEIFEHDFHDLMKKKYSMDLSFQQNLNPYDRESFGNSVENFHNYLRDPKNHQEAVQRGFLISRPVPEPEAPAAPAAKKTPKGGTPPAGEGA